MAIFHSGERLTFSSQVVLKCERSCEALNSFPLEENVDVWQVCQRPLLLHILSSCLKLGWVKVSEEMLVTSYANPHVWNTFCNGGTDSVLFEWPFSVCFDSWYIIWPEVRTLTREAFLLPISFAVEADLFGKWPVDLWKRFDKKNPKEHFWCVQLILQDSLLPCKNRKRHLFNPKGSTGDLCDFSAACEANGCSADFTQARSCLMCKKSFL